MNASGDELVRKLDVSTTTPKEKLALLATEGLMAVKANEEAEKYLVHESSQFETWLYEEQDNNSMRNLEYISTRMNKAREIGLGRITEDHFATDFHIGLYQGLAMMFRRLCKDRYNGKTGQFTKVLVGPRGEGKTTCLRNFASAAPLLAPNLVSYFVTANSEGELPVRVRSVESLCRLVLEDLLDAPNDASPSEATQDFLVRKLEERGLRLLLVVDVADLLYKAQLHQRESFDFAYRSLSELQALGNNTCGWLMIILSGSSVRLSTFIKGTQHGLPAEEIQDFPLLSWHLDMNCSRYRRMAVELITCDSLDNALEVLYPSAELVPRNRHFSDEQKRHARTKMFERGCIARNLGDEVMHSKHEGVLPFNHSASICCMKLLCLWLGHFENRKLLVRLGHLSQTWTDRFWYGKWPKFRCRSCTQATEQCEHAIQETAWENTFKPIAIFRHFDLHGPELQGALLEKLQDAGYLLIIQNEIFPVSIEEFQQNLIQWAPCLRAVKRRGSSLLCLSSDIPSDLLRGLSAPGMDLVKDAFRGGIENNVEVQSDRVHDRDD